MGGAVGYLIGGKFLAAGVFLFGAGLVLPEQFPWLKATRNRHLVMWLILVIGFLMYWKFSPLPGAIKITDRLASVYDVPEIGIGMTGLGARLIIRQPDGIAFKSKTGPVVTVRLDSNKKLRATFTVRDLYGNDASEITDGHVSVNSNVVYQMNKTDDFIELIDQKGDVIIQAMAVGGILLIEGSLRCKDGTGLYFSHNNTGGFMTLLLPNVGSPETPKRLCQYPVPEFFGKCSSELDAIRSQVSFTKSNRGYSIGGTLDICIPGTINR